MRGKGVAGEPTELEGCVQGVVWQQGPCTAYTIRKVFLDSPSPPSGLGPWSPHVPGRAARRA